MSSPTFKTITDPLDQNLNLVLRVGPDAVTLPSLCREWLCPDDATGGTNIFFQNHVNRQ